MSLTLPARFRTAARSPSNCLTFFFEFSPKVVNVVSSLLLFVRSLWIDSELGLFGFFRRNFVILRADLFILSRSNDIFRLFVMLSHNRDSHSCGLALGLPQRCDVPPSPPDINR